MKWLFPDQNMDCIYHGCATRYSDGTTEIIEKGEKCLIATNKCF